MFGVSLRYPPYHRCWNTKIILHRSVYYSANKFGSFVLTIVLHYILALKIFFSLNNLAIIKM
nr:MAG TPA: hypothetical protein [Caudoviricetes sp.]